MGLPQRLARSFWTTAYSATRNSVFFFPYTPSIAGFLVGFTGFTLHHRTGAPTALEHITDAISRDRTITQFVRAHRDAFPSHVDGDEAVEIFIASIGVDGMEIINHKMAVSPTDNVARFNELRNLVGVLTIHTSIHGQGRRYKNVECRICPTLTTPLPSASSRARTTGSERLPRPSRPSKTPVTPRAKPLATVGAGAEMEGGVAAEATGAGEGKTLVVAEGAATN
ncbi:hypothetical protein B0H13DRAFT_2669445 [Mycena leptocephala]|nr:hypothetical protein B0H13DRAFT_2669445 [Mycena leptocephala]